MKCPICERSDTLTKKLTPLSVIVALMMLIILYIPYWYLLKKENWCKACAIKAVRVKK